VVDTPTLATKKNCVAQVGSNLQLFQTRHTVFLCCQCRSINHFQKVIASSLAAIRFQMGFKTIAVTTSLLML